MTHFSDLKLAEPLDRALRELGHATPTPIQAQAIPKALQGHDIMGIAQTGTGKTAAFTLPTLHHIFTVDKDVPKRGARVLILAPTRELANQIAVSVRDYGRHMMDLSVACIFGGVPINRQIKRLVHGNDVIVATPGRLIDLLDRKAIRIDEVEVLILDEADQMMDMGFIHALKKIVPLLPKQRQTLFFSATLAPAIKKLSQQFLTDPAHISVTPANTTAEKVEQRVYHVNQAEKQSLLSVALLDPDVGRSLVFTRTKHGADRIVKRLAQVGILAVAIHGNKSQGQRQRALEDYRSGKVDTLIATDIAARGIDIPDITHVFNYEIPNVPEQYVHRIGRTARAQRTGIAVSFVDKSENNYLRDIEKLLKQKLPKMDMPEGMDEKLKALKARKPLPPPEKPKPDARKGRGKSKKKGRFSKSEKAKNSQKATSKAKEQSIEKTSKQTQSKDNPKTPQPAKTQSRMTGGKSNQPERKRVKKTDATPNKTGQKTKRKTPNKPLSPEGRAAQSYSGKAYKGKGPKKIKPSRAKRKANRQASGKTKPR
jgi:ATP-dependent RNA helicase RhlE